MTFLYIIGIIGILAILILVHELGHLLAAKSIKLPVKIFSIGFPLGNLVPPIRLFKWGETEFQFNVLLLGGFCAFLDDEKQESGNHSDYLRNRSPLERLWVISAGVIANALFSLFILILMVFILGVSNYIPQDGVKVVDYPLANSPAAKAGIKPGDTILAINDTVLKNTKNKLSVDMLREIVSVNKGKQISLKVKREKNILILHVIPNNEGLIGVKIAPEVKEVRRPIQNILEPFIVGTTTFVTITVRLLDTLGQLIIGNIELSQVGGPIAVGKFGVQIAQNDPSQLFLFTALIGIELVILNLLPIPALDGGHILFVLIELIRRKPLPKKLEEGLLYTGFVILMSLGIVLIFKDIYTSFSGG